MHKKQNKRRTGTEYERRAGAYLEERGYEILEYNFRCRMGEIDIIARDGEYLVFCEVKYRLDARSGHPAQLTEGSSVLFQNAPCIISCAAGLRTRRAVLTW